jgi:predicted PurR-regulated permease PerM
MNNTLKIIIGVIAIVIVGGLVFKLINIAIGFAIVAIIGYLAFNFVYPKIVKKTEDKSEEPLSPLEKYKNKL